MLEDPHILEGLVKVIGAGFVVWPSEKIWRPALFRAYPLFSAGLRLKEGPCAFQRFTRFSAGSYLFSFASSLQSPGSRGCDIRPPLSPEGILSQYLVSRGSLCGPGSIPKSPSVNTDGLILDKPWEIV